MCLFGNSCPLAIRCVSLSILQSGCLNPWSSSWAAAPDRRKVDQSWHDSASRPHGSLFMEWPCRGLTCMHNRKKKKTHTHTWAQRRWGLGKKSQCPPLRLTTRSPPQWLRNLLHFNKIPSSESCHFNICLLLSFGINVRFQTRQNALAGMSYSCFSLCISYGYLCRRLSNADFLWQVSIQGLGSNWSTNRKQKIEMAERKRGGN